MVWYAHLFQNFPQYIVIYTVKGFGIVNKAEIDVSLELSCFFNDPEDVGNLISGSSSFSKTSLNIWKFTVQVLLKHGLENIELFPLDCCYCCSVAKSCPTLCDSMDCSPPGSAIHGVSPGKNAGEGCHTLLQGSFPTQGSSPALAGRFFTTGTPGKPSL